MDSSNHHSFPDHNPSTNDFCNNEWISNRSIHTELAQSQFLANLSGIVYPNVIFFILKNDPSTYDNAAKPG